MDITANLPHLPAATQPSPRGSDNPKVAAIVAIGQTVMNLNENRIPSIDNPRSAGITGKVSPA